MSELDLGSVTSSGADPTPSAPPQVATTPAPTGMPTPTPSAPAASPTPGAPPEGYVPSYRLREAREAAARQAQAEARTEIDRIRAEADQYRRQLHSLVGVQPPADPQVDQVKQQFGTLYPGLSKMEEQAQRIMEMLERQGDQESQIQHYWTQHGRQVMDKLFSHAQEALGGPLTDEGQRQLHSSFVGFVQSSPEMQARYANDPTIVEDFWKAFTSSFIDPVRRSAAAGVATRAGLSAGLPQDTPGGVPRATPIAQPSNLDERANLAWAQYQTTNRNR